MMKEVLVQDATGQAALVRSGEISAEELLELTIARVEALNPALRAVVTPLYDGARRALARGLPEGPFRGVPTMLKDIGATSAGDPSYAGMALLRDLRFRATTDAYLTQRLRRAGFVLIGKTSTPELGLLPTTEPRAFGPTPNPFDPTRTAGGSSGGSAVAVATGMVPVAHASDGGGSIRIPASCTGLVGLKPSRGRVSLGPLIGQGAGGLVCEFMLTRSLRDSAHLLDLLRGEMPGDPYTAPEPRAPYQQCIERPPPRLRVALVTEAVSILGESAPVDSACADAAIHLAHELESFGHVIEPLQLVPLHDPLYWPSFRVLWSAGVCARLQQLAPVVGRPLNAGDVEPLTWALAQEGLATSAGGYLNACAWIERKNREIAALWSDFDLVLTPTLAERPVPLGTFDADPENPLEAFARAARFAPFTAPFNATGQPALSVPTPTPGLPIGVQLIARYGREDVLLSTAAQIERLRPFVHRKLPGAAECSNAVDTGSNERA